MKRIQISTRSIDAGVAKRLVFMAGLFIVSMFSLHGTEPDKALRTVTLQLKWKHQFQFAGYYAAVEKGFFREAGLSVKLVEAAGNMNPADAVFEGRAEFGICTSDILLLRAAGKPAVVLATVFQHSPQVLVASRKAGIEHLHDLAGRKIAMEPNAADLIAYLNDEGLPREKYTALPHQFNVSSLLNGEIDALSAYSTDEPFLLREAAFDYSIFNPAMGGIDFYGDVLFTTETLIRKEPALVQRFRDAALKGWAYAMDHPDEITGLILDKYSQRHSRDHLAFEASQMQKLVLKDVVGIGYTNPARWQQILSIYQRLNLIDSTLTTDGLFYTDYIKPAYPVPWRIILSLLAVILVIGSAGWFFFNTSRRLRHEVQQRKRIENDLSKSNILFRSILRASPDGIILTDLEGHIRMASPAALRLFGYEREEELMGKSIDAMLTGAKQKREQLLTPDAVKGTVTGPTETTGMHHGGGVFDCESNTELVRHPGGEVTGILTVVRDIRERKQAEERISLQHEELQRLSSEKDKLYTIMAHDLRSPMHGLLGLTEILSTQHSTMDMQEITRLTRLIHNSIRQLNNLLEDLLEWTRIQLDALGFHPQAFDLGIEAEGIASLMKETLDRKEIRLFLDLKEKKMVFADKNMTNTIVRNLISNAIKFTPRGGTITVTIGRSAEGSVVLTVADSGIGMSAEVLRSLFSHAGQINRKGTDNETSTGLGLLIVKELVGKLNGDIRVTSQEGSGSTFTVTLPGSEG